MRVLGFDASLYRTGVACIDDGQPVYFGAIEVKATQKRGAQLRQIFDSVVTLLYRLEPDVVVIEDSESWQRDGKDRTKTIVALAQARAAILLAIELSPTSPIVVQIDSHDVRRDLCANRSASKLQVVENLRQRGYTLPIREKRVRRNGHYEVERETDLDVADALACCLIVWQQERLRAIARDQGHVV